MAEGNWFYAVAGQQQGPVALETLRQKAQAGEVGGDDLVWTEGMPEWSPARFVEALGVGNDIGATPAGGQYDLSAAAAAAGSAQPGYTQPYGAPGGTLGYGTYAYHSQEQYGGFWLRFVAAILDGVIIFIPGFLLQMLAEFMARRSPGQNAVIIATVISWVLQTVIAWLYSAMFESSAYQATPGKMALGLRVTDLNGLPITFARATGRHFGKMVSAIICYIGFIMAAFTERKQALHDQMAGTLVLRKQG